MAKKDIYMTFLTAATLLLPPGVAMSQTQDTGTLEVAAVTNASTGRFAPYLIGSNNHGRIVGKSGAWLDVKFSLAGPQDRPFSWYAGAEIITGASSKNSYALWDADMSSWTSHRLGQPSLWVQQLYLGARHKALSLTLGMKDAEPAFMNRRLSSGDYVLSANARPIPQAMAVLDYSDIPFTRGWMQVNCAISYGVMTDNRYNDEHFNRYNYHLSSDNLFSYKRVHFRTNPAKPFHVMAGAQVGSFFGGKTLYYERGVYQGDEHFSKSLKTFVNMIFPVFVKSESFVQGSTLGCWDFCATLRYGADSRVSAYFQWPFEDGSGIAKRNGFDGIWGLELKFPGEKAVEGIVVEYLDFRNQSGPIHYAPGDYGGSTLPSSSSGRDNYYNNSRYNSYANYGMSIGTPFFISPVYNLSGYPAFACNRISGMHFGIDGHISSSATYRVLYSYQRGLGTYDFPYKAPRTTHAFMLDAHWRLRPDLSVKAAIAYDRGDLRGNNLGAMLSCHYHVNL